MTVEVEDRAAGRGPVAGDRVGVRKPRAATARPEDAAVLRPARIREPEHHEFSGTVSVNVGPFEELDSIGRFVESMSSVPGVGGVRIRTFDGQSVIFDVDLAEPTPLIARLRGRSPLLLRLRYANERIIRLKVV
jgi:hypothetical protein